MYGMVKKLQGIGEFIFIFMFEVKKQSHTKWFLDGDLKFQLQVLEHGKIGVWVSFQNFNICLTMLMYDFIDWCRDVNIIIEIDNSWNNHMGFVIEEGDLELLLIEIKRFIDYYNIKPNEDNEKFSDSEWYSY